MKPVVWLIAAVLAWSSPQAWAAAPKEPGQRGRAKLSQRNRELLRQNLLADLQEKKGYTEDQLKEIEKKIRSMSDGQIAALLEHYRKTKKDAGETVSKISPEKADSPLRPSRSSPIALAPDGSEVWAVLEDHDWVTALRVLDGPPYLERMATIPVGRRPRNLAVSPDGARVYVANQDSASVAVIDRAHKCLVGFLGCGWGSQPYGVVVSPDSRYVYVSTYATSKVLKFDVGNGVAGEPVNSVRVAQGPWALALTGDGRRLLVGQGINAGPYQSNDAAIVTRVDTETFQARPIFLEKDERRDTGGYVSMLRSIAMFPGGRWALVACQHIDADRGMVRDKRPSLSFKTEIQPVLCVIDLLKEEENRPARILLSGVGAVVNAPSAVDYFILGDKFFGAIAAQGSEDAKILEFLRRDEVQATERGVVRLGGVLGRWPSGAAPDGLCVDSRRKRLYVLNLLNRSVSVVPLAEPVSDMKEVAEVPLAKSEPLGATVLRGKKLFHSSELGTSKDSWISCANCHPDNGGSDGRIWDFSQFGGSREESARTISLRGATGYRARLFWQGRADEVQDLESGVRALFGGQYIPGEPNPHLEKPNAGRSAEFDAIATYIADLRRVAPSPHRQENGQLSEAAKRGREIFYTGCDFCHRPAMRFCRTSRAKPGGFEAFDVGTGGKYNVPPLVGVWEARPWLHHGQAPTLRAIFTTHNKGDRHGATSDLRPREIVQLAEFVRCIDEGGDVRAADGKCPDNQPPAAEAGHLPHTMSVQPGQLVAFLGSRSFDRDGNITSWTWSFGDDSAPQTVEARATFGDVVHAFPNRRATYRVTLRVTDDQGASGEKSWYIGVGCPADPQHIYQGR